MEHSSASSSSDECEVAPDPTLLIQREISNQWGYTVEELQLEVKNIARKCFNAEISINMYDNAIENCMAKIEESDDSHAHYLLGYYNQYGYGSEGKDLVQAAYHYQKAIDYQHPLAYFGLFTLDKSEQQHRSSSYEINYLNVLTEDELAKKHANNLIKCAAFGQHVDAIRTLRSLYHNLREWREEINEIRKDHLRIIMATDSNILTLTDSYNCLGFLEYLFTVCTTIDGFPDAVINNNGNSVSASFEYFLKAGQLGDARGYINYAFYKQLDESNYHQLISQCQLDQAKFYSKATLLGSKLALLKVHSCTKFNNPDELSNVTKHRLYLENVVEYLPYSDVFCQLGCLYANATPRTYYNLKKAMNYLLQAMVSHPSMAGSVVRLEFFYVGFMYEHGIGVEKSIRKAAHFYASSIYQHHDINLSLCRLAKLIEKNKLPDLDVCDAVKIYQYGALSMVPQIAPYCHYRLGSIFHRHQGEDDLYDPLSAHLHFDIAFTGFNDNALEGRAVAMDRYIVSKLMEHGLSGSISVRAAGCLTTLAPQRNFYIAENHFGENYISRFYAMKAWLRAKNITEKDNTVSNDRKNWLKKEIKKRWGLSPVNLIAQAYEIMQRCYKSCFEGEHLKEDYCLLLQQLQKQPTAGIYYKLALLHQYGFGVAARDLNRAVEYYRKAIEFKCPMASLNLGLLYGCEEDGDNDMVCYQVFPTVKELAVVQLDYFLNSVLDGSVRGIDVIRSRLKAYECWQVLVEDRMRDLQKLLGKKYLGIIGKKADDKTLSRCHAELGILLTAKKLDYKQLDKGVVAEILKRFAESAKLGNASGAFLYAYIYMKTTPQGDESNILHYYQKAAELGHPGANRILFIYYNNNDNTVMTNQNRVIDVTSQDIVKYLQRAAEFGFPDAKANLGMLYMEGRRGCEHNLALARQLLYQAINDKLLGYCKVALPITELGFLYEHYWQTTNHYELAAHYYAVDASDRIENCQSYCYLANLIIKGKIESTHGVKDAVKLCESAMYRCDDSYSAYAHYLLAKLYSRGPALQGANEDASEEHYRYAFELFYKGSRNNLATNCMAYYYLGVMCHFGCGTVKDVNMAKQFYCNALECRRGSQSYLVMHYAKKSQDKLDDLEHCDLMECD